MNKAELAAAIVSKFAAVLKTTERSPVGGVTYCTANVLDVVGDVARNINVSYFVVDDGGPGEAAYWGGSEPKPTPAPVVPTFTDEARAWLQDKIDVTVGGQIIRMFNGLAADNVQERAVVFLELEAVATGELSTVKVALWKVEGEFQYKAYAVTA